MRYRTHLVLIVAGFLAVSILQRERIRAAQAEEAAEAVDFNRDIRPILSDHCFACHGPDEQQRQAGLRLDTKEGAFADRGGYQLIVPGDAPASRLYQRISHEQEIARMPPPGFERKLTREQVELIRRWIDQGAEWETHWSFIPAARPALPKVRKESWPRNPIDHFVLARLEREGLEPSPEADKATLLRRLSFDLTGLPPAPAELDAFLANDSPDAYEKQVDRLLKSPRFGERMAMQWLDLARYADTHGYHIDSHRDMWRWRDWVIDAFNRNMPFDRFTMEQLAGDLLPDPAPAQKIATGFNRNHMINFEGGAIPEEYLTEYIVDRVETTATVWMALTMGCARCHDHKYDPIKQKQFYEFFAFFNTIPEQGLDGRRGNAEPVIQLASTRQQQLADRLDQTIKATEETLPDEEAARLQSEWESAALSSVPGPPEKGLIAHYPFDGDLEELSGRHKPGNTVRGELIYDYGRVNQAAGFSGETHVELGDAIPIDRDAPFTLAFWMRVGSKRDLAVLEKLDESRDLRGFDISMDHFVPLPDLKRGQHLTVRLIHRWPNDAVEIRTAERLIQGDWYHVALASDGSGRASGLRLYANGELQKVEVVRDSLSGSILTSRPLEIGGKKRAKPFSGSLDDLRVYGRALSAEEVEALAIHHPIRSALAEKAGACPDVGQRAKKEKDSGDYEQPEKKKKSKEERRCEALRSELREYYLTHQAPKRIRKLYAELEHLRGQRDELEKVIPNVMVMEEMAKPRDTFVLGRGDYRNHGERVSPTVPAWLSPLPKDAPPNRLGLARWLVDPNHPLTARVAVNRYWQMYFGTGLVRTAEDFGSQGEAPSHPKLLDWLATEFMRSGWDIKAMQRLIVTSATYRQASRVTPALLERDPENRLLARGPRFRLPAEIVRDNALAVSGLLNGEIGGPSVFPYQPKGVWEDVAYGDVYSAQSYTPSHGEDLYRRSMYTFWKRTAPPPSLAAFDAPDREKCTARRARTNTPLQALVLMNDPTYVEAARALAERMIREAGDDAAGRVRFAYRRALARPPAPGELDLLLTMVHQQLEDFRRDEKAALDLLSVGESPHDPQLDPAELAAWTTVASAILNLDETITKE